MKIEYSRNLNGSFMIVRDAEFLYETYELLMLLNNKISGLLSLQVIINGGKIEYWYEITGMTALDTVLGQETLDAAKLRRLTEDMFDMNRGLENYLLDGENVCYLPEMVYFDRSLKKYRFAYLPGSKKASAGRLHGLMEYLLTKLDHTDPEAVKLGYTLYEKSAAEFCSAGELLSCTAVQEETPVKAEEKKADPAAADKIDLSRAVLVSEPAPRRKRAGGKGRFRMRERRAETV